MLSKCKEIAKKDERVERDRKVMNDSCSQRKGQDRNGNARRLREKWWDDGATTPAPAGLTAAAGAGSQAGSARGLPAHSHPPRPCRSLRQAPRHQCFPN